jgi:hypothetical protein
VTVRFENETLKIVTTWSSKLRRELAGRDVDVVVAQADTPARWEWAVNVDGRPTSRLCLTFTDRFDPHGAVLDLQLPKSDGTLVTYQSTTINRYHPRWKIRLGDLCSAWVANTADWASGADDA